MSRPEMLHLTRKERELADVLEARRAVISAASALCDDEDAVMQALLRASVALAEAQHALEKSMRAQLEATT